MDNDESILNCATSYEGYGWWHKKCFDINFNAKYSTEEDIEPGRGIIWAHIGGYVKAMQKTKMRIKPAPR